MYTRKATNLIYSLIVTDHLIHTQNYFEFVTNPMSIPEEQYELKSSSCALTGMVAIARKPTKSSYYVAKLVLAKQKIVVLLAITCIARSQRDFLMPY